MPTRSSVKQEESVSPSMLAGEVPPTGAPGVRAPTHEPVSQLLVNFILLDGGPSGPWVKVSCWASSGSPPITYSLVGRDSGTYMKQTQNYKEAANFSFPLTQTSCWLRCQAANNISAQHSALTLVPPGKLPEGPTFVLAVSTVAVLSTVAVISGRLSRARHLSFPDARHPHQVEEINFLMILRTRPPDLLAPQG